MVDVVDALSDSTEEVVFLRPCGVASLSSFESLSEASFEGGEGERLESCVAEDGFGGDPDGGSSFDASCDRACSAAMKFVA